jgi:hypothetical protein
MAVTTAVWMGCRCFAAPQILEFIPPLHPPLPAAPMNDTCAAFWEHAL